MKKSEIILFLSMVTILLVIANWWGYEGWMFLPLALFLINTIFNGINYRNKSYYLINFIILISMVPIWVFNSGMSNMDFIFIISAVTILASFYGYFKREDNPKIPWRNEW